MTILIKIFIIFLLFIISACDNIVPKGGSGTIGNGLTVQPATLSSHAMLIQAGINSSDQSESLKTIGVFMMDQQENYKYKFYYFKKPKADCSEKLRLIFEIDYNNNVSAEYITWQSELDDLSCQGIETKSFYLKGAETACDIKLEENSETQKLEIKINNCKFNEEIPTLGSFLHVGELNLVVTTDRSKQLKTTLPSFSGGSGTLIDPFKLSILKDLESIGTNPLLMDKYFELTSTIDLGNAEVMIGSEIFPFKGGFEGNGYSLSNLQILRPAEDNIGFIRVTNGAIIQNLHLSGVNVQGDTYVGGFIGSDKLYSGTKAHNVTVDGTVSANNIVGGVAGYFNGTISNSSSNVSIPSGDRAGGLIGYIYRGTVEKCNSKGTLNGKHFTGGLIGLINSYTTINNSYSTMTVNGSQNTGGLIGYAETLILNNSYATGDVTSDNNYVGGLIGSGQLWGTITDSYSTGNVKGVGYVGGFIGDIFGFETHRSYAIGNVTASFVAGGFFGHDFSAHIFDCYARGDVNATNGAGSFGGSKFAADITNSYATGLITAGNSGGFIGLNSDPGNEYNLFWNITINPGLFDFGDDGGTDDPEITGETTANMTDFLGTIYKSSGWDFTDTWEMVPGQNDNYPMLQWQND